MKVIKQYKIEKGDTFVCTKKVVMKSSKMVVYRKGYVYISEKDGCITNAYGEIDHYWVVDNKLFRKSFMLLKEVSCKPK